MSEHKLNHFINRTVESLELINAEYGRTYREYLCFKFTDGEKIMLYGNIPYAPKPTVEEMKRAPKFFTPEDISEKVLLDEREKRRMEEARLVKKRRDLEELKKELGEK